MIIPIRFMFVLNMNRITHHNIYHNHVCTIYFVIHLEEFGQWRIGELYLIMGADNTEYKYTLFVTSQTNRHYSISCPDWLEKDKEHCHYDRSVNR